MSYRLDKESDERMEVNLLEELVDFGGPKATDPKDTDVEKKSKKPKR